MIIAGSRNRDPAIIKFAQRAFFPTNMLHVAKAPIATIAEGDEDGDVPLEKCDFSGP